MGIGNDSIAWEGDGENQESIGSRYVVKVKTAGLLVVRRECMVLLDEGLVARHQDCGADGSLCIILSCLDRLSRRGNGQALSVKDEEARVGSTGHDAGRGDEDGER